MTVSWFRGHGSSGSLGGNHRSHDVQHQHGLISDMSSDAKTSIKDAVRALYPPKNRYSDSFLFDLDNGARSRFSSLLLEHGEQHIQDWAVIAYTTPGKANPFLAASSPRGIGRNTFRGDGKDGTGAKDRRTANETQWMAQKSTSRKLKRTNHKGSVSHRSALARSQQKQSKHQTHIDKETHPTAHMTKIEGRLHLCSRSIVFEPTDDVSRPILRCPFVQMEAPPKEFPSSAVSNANKTGNYEPMCVEFLSFKHICCKNNNKIGPTTSVSVPTQFRFTFLHSKPSTLVELCNKLFAILHMESTNKSTSPTSKSKAEQAMQMLLRPLYERPFDPTNFVDVRERSLLPSNLRCHIVQPLQKHPGCLVVTHERIYFQPSYGVLSDDTTSPTNHHSSRAMHWNQTDVIATARRYSGLQDNALEVFWKTGKGRGNSAGSSHQQSTLFELRNKHEREQLLRLLPANIPCHTNREFVLRAAQEWQKKTISNYEYLLVLNSAASRTVHDLSRYPVFPWVLSDYTSEKLDLQDPKSYRDLTKPIGALNPERLQYFQQRYQSMVETNMHMGDDGGGVTPFLYGTHYSAAGYVLYYLIRSMPEHMLCLQNGKFDTPDRMFHNVESCYNCVLTNHADVKELIPEFFTPDHDSFLMNIKSLQLGATQTGDRVDDVILPNWAKSPRDFVRKHSRALESEICTAMLPRWFDLIFGFKSRGDAAKEADNLFHHSAYMGPADWSRMSSDAERYQAELQAMEFGIVPDQLFVGPHPLRHETVDDSFIHSELGRTMSVMTTEDGKGDAWELLDIPLQDVGIGNDVSTGHSDSNDMRTAALMDYSRLRADSDVVLDPAVAGSDPSDDSQFGLDTQQWSTGSTSVDVLDHRGQHKVTHGTNRSSNKSDLPLSGTGTNDSGHHGVGVGAFSNLSIQPSLSNVSSGSGIFGGGPIAKADTTVVASAAPSSDWDMKIIERVRLHDEAISGCSLNQPNSSLSSGENPKPILTTVSLDGGLKVHHVTSGVSKTDDQSSRGFTSTLSRFSYLSMSRVQGSEPSETKLTEFRSHTSRDPLACLALTSDGQGGQVAFAGGHDDVVLAYGINSACAVASVYSHRDAVTGLDLVPRDPTSPPTKLWRENATHIMISGSWDATIKVWSVTVSTGETVAIDREPLAELFDADSSIVSVSACSLADGGIVIAAGCADGSFSVWNLHCDGVKVVIHKEQARRGSGPCSVVKLTWIHGALKLFTGFSTGKVACFELTDGAMRRVAAVSLGIAVQCLTYSEGILLIGCADGGLRLIQVRDDGSFSTKPTLWNAVNEKSSPGLTSISLAFVGDFMAGTAKCMCCTGAEDGSVALFELKKSSR